MMARSYHMTPAEFRDHGRRMVDWLADYMERVSEMPILPDVKPGEVISQLPSAAPEAPEAFDAVVRDLEEIIMPALTHWQSPGWFAYFPANVSPPAILGELVAAGLGQQGMMWSTSPAATELEQVVLDWLVELLDLPSAWRTAGPGGGVLQMSASDSTHIALVVARGAASGRAGVDSLVAYTSSQAHSSVEKGARIAGYQHLRLVAVDDTYAMRPDALANAMAEDEAAGRTPAFVASTVGTTGTTAVDPVAAIGKVARAHGAWHHVDAAYAGTAMICPEFRHHQEGLDVVDSYVFNPHKWMFTNLDCSAFYVADRTPLLSAMSILAPYLKNPATETGAVIDYRDWHVSLGRRFRALKLWFVLRSYGAEGIRHHIRRHVALARDLADRIRADARFEVIAPVPFSLVCFRHVTGDEATKSLAAAVNATGEVAVTLSDLDGQAFIRVAVGQTYTDQQHVDRLWSLLDSLAPSVPISGASNRAAPA